MGIEALEPLRSVFERSHGGNQGSDFDLAARHQLDGLGIFACRRGAALQPDLAGHHFLQRQSRLFGAILPIRVTVPPLRTLSMAWRWSRCGPRLQGQHRRRPPPVCCSISCGSSAPQRLICAHHSRGERARFKRVGSMSATDSCRRRQRSAACMVEQTDHAGADHQHGLSFYDRQLTCTAWSATETASSIAASGNDISSGRR